MSKAVLVLDEMPGVCAGCPCDYEPTVFEATEYCPHCGAKMDGDGE